MSLRPPKQDRSRRTLDRLTQAAMELMAMRGVEKTSVADIVHRADSSVGSFYARFEGKTDFVEYLERRVWEDARERWDGAMERLDGRELTTPQLVSGLVRLLVETSDADLNRRRALGMASGSEARANAFHQHVLDHVARLLTARREEFVHPEPARAVALGYRVIVGALQEMPPLTESEGMGQEALVSELTRLYLGYLGSEAAPPAPRTVEPLSQARARAASEGRASEEPIDPTPAPIAATQEPAEVREEPGPPPRKTPREPEPVRVDFFDVWG